MKWETTKENPAMPYTQNILMVIDPISITNMANIDIKNMVARTLKGTPNTRTFSYALLYIFIR